MTVRESLPWRSNSLGWLDRQRSSLAPQRGSPQPIRPPEQMTDPALTDDGVRGIDPRIPHPVRPQQSAIILEANHL